MSLISICLRRLSHHGLGQSSSLALRHAATARLSRLARPEPLEALLPSLAAASAVSLGGLSDDSEPSAACGWYESSQALRQGLAVTEWADTEQADGLRAWNAARWTVALPSGSAAAQACS